MTEFLTLIVVGGLLISCFAKWGQMESRWEREYQEGEDAKRVRFEAMMRDLEIEHRARPERLEAAAQKRSERFAGPEKTPEKESPRHHRLKPLADNSCRVEGSKQQAEAYVVGSALLRQEAHERFYDFRPTGDAYQEATRWAKATLTTFMEVQQLRRASQQ